MEDTPILHFKVADQPYTLDVGKFTGRELMDFHKAVGMPLGQAMRGGTDSLVWVAAVKWLLDRRFKKDLTFDEVLDNITLEQVSFGEAEEVAPDPPTQEGASSEASPRLLTSTASGPGTSST